MRELARIPVPAAAWFAVADGALWVTIRPDSASAGSTLRRTPSSRMSGTCRRAAAPVVAFDSLWQSACDAGVILRIDPATNEVQDRIPSAGHSFLTFTGDRLIALAPDGLATLDPERRTFAPLPNPDAAGAEFLAFDGETIWVETATQLVRIDPANGRTTARLDIPGGRAITFANGSAWLATPTACSRSTLRPTRRAGRFPCPAPRSSPS